MANTPRKNSKLSDVSLYRLNIVCNMPIRDLGGNEHSPIETLMRSCFLDHIGLEQTVTFPEPL